MNKEILLYLERKMRGGEDSRRSNRYDNKDSRGGDNRRRNSRHSNDQEGYPVRARAPRGNYEDYEDYGYDYEDERDYEDSRDYHNYKHLRLTKADIMHAEESLHNVDGTHGPHLDYQQAIQAAEKLGIRFDAYTEKEFCLAMNMMYADYALIIQKHNPPEKMAQICAELAKAFFDDPDGPEPSEKLALYIHCISQLRE
jgi:hypothetical protein